ncbi:MAG TPA: hypothetical protein VF057_10130 [Thermoanaerobaculia bacterium]
MGRFLALVALFVASSVAAAPIEFEPKTPDSGTPVEITVAGEWRDGCVPSDPQVSVGQGSISVLLRTRFAVCTGAVTQWRHSVRVGPLTPGLYLIGVSIDDTADDDPRPVQYADSRMWVRDAGAVFSVDPEATRGDQNSRVVHVIALDRNHPLADCNASGCAVPQVRLSGGPFDATGGASAASVEVVDPFHLLVQLPAVFILGRRFDVATMTISTGSRTLTTRAAVGFYEEFDRHEESVFEGVLIPVSLNGAGARGSEWRTEITMRHTNPFPIVTNIMPVAVEPHRTVRPTVPALPNDDRGAFFLPLRQHAELFKFTALIRDVSREAERWGTELPIVRAADFQRDTIDLLDVPIDSRYRTALRVYFYDQTGSQSRVSVVITPVDATLNQGVASFAVSPSDRRRPGYVGIADLRTLFQFAPDGRYHVSIVARPSHLRFWAMASVTNNDTQHVTVISPQ